MSDQYPIVEVAPAELHAAPYQPASRTELNAALSKLQKSIKNDGLQYPPLVIRKADGNGYTIIDGHRRVRVARELMWPKISVIVSSQGDAKRLFAAVSGASKPLSATEWIHVHLGGGALPPGQTATCIKRIDHEMGREFLVEMAQKGLSPQVWNFASKLLKYLNLSEDEKPAILRWLVKHKLTRPALAAIQMDTAPDRVIKAFREDKNSL